MSFKIIFAGTPDFAVPTLQSLIDSDNEIVAVLTQPDRHSGRGQHVHRSPVKKLAEKNNLLVLQPETLRDEAIQNELANLKPDLMIVVAYGILLPKTVLEIPEYGCMNVHASVLPRWRGAAPIHHAILAGDEKTGVTIMQMDEGLDTGDILFIDECDIAVDETTATLHDKLAEMGAHAMLKVLKNLSDNKLKPVKQDDKSATHASKISKKDAEINWHDSAKKIEQTVRAYNPWPVAFTHVHDQQIRIWSVGAVNEQTDLEPGTIIAEHKDSIDVATGDGVIRLLEIQLPGAKKMSVLDVLNSKSDWFTEGVKLC